MPKSIPNFFKKLSFKKSNVHMPFDPKRDWKIIIFSFTGLSLLLAGFSGYLFFKINRGEIFTSGQQNTSTNQVIDKKLLDDTVARFETKKARLSELESQTSVTPDPSL